MLSYKQIAVKAQDLKPGDIFSGRIDETTYPLQQVVRKITIEIYGDCTDVTIETRKDKKFIVEHGREFLKEISPAEEAEMEAQVSGPGTEEFLEISSGIERLDTEISDCAFSILDRIEMHIKHLVSLKDGASSQEFPAGTFDTIGDDFKQAAETAIALAEHAGDQEALREELMQIDIDHAADEGPNGRNV